MYGDDLPVHKFTAELWWGKCIITYKIAAFGLC